MKRKGLGIALTLVCWTLAGSCVLDDREISLVEPLRERDGGLPAESGGEGNTLSVPQLAVGPEAIDLGRVTTGFSARTRVRVENTGTGSLQVPAVRFAQGSHADFSLIQNECSSTLAPGQACELRVQVVPSDSGPRTATLEVSSEAGGSASVALSALGLPAGDLILAPVAGSSEDFGGARVGATLEGAFSISGPSDVASGPLTFFVNRPEFQLLAPAEGDCVPDTTSLVAGQTCTVRVGFTPTERGPVEATLTGASESVGAVSVTLSGRGLLPAVLRTAAPTVDFDGVVVLSSAQRSIRFENAGDEPLTLAGARLVPEGAEGFSILSSDCGAGASLQGGAACLVQLGFRPPRVGEEMTAELVVAGTEPGQSQSIGLRGIGLEQGVLLVTEQTPGDADFGEVLLGESSEHTFQIQNPSAQQSGGLELDVSEGFEFATPPAEGECVPGSTSLVNGESCAVRVKFVPSGRASISGSLTVSSPLAGARDLPLLGRGILPASLLVDREVNFGRVLTGPVGQSRTLSIENAGDQPLPPPTLALAGSSPTQVAAFSFESHCTLALAFGERCDVTLTFAPTAAAAHAVTLEVEAAGSSASVLLLGEAQLPGRLVLDAAAGGSTDFGDVAVGSNVTRSFTLQNPGQIASGRLTISSDNNRFAPIPGDCNTVDPAGLVDGASCTFSVRFTPNDNLPQAANLSVQSPGAGRAGGQVSGRGRLPATLSSDTGNRDLGRANIGQAGITQPQNEFTWIINNQGDLPTGTLALLNDNPTEFSIRNDSCSNSSVAARSSCQMIIRFLPGVAGNRTARIGVNEPTGGRSATLVLTGLGVQLANLGQSCANADCAQGTCTRGVCCDVACDRTCQVCSAGRCTNQTNHEVCGNGAACFGVDNCKLPEGRACSANGGDAQCGSGQCEQRLGGTGTGDRICCLDDCGNALQCNAQNRCQAPPLGAGAACGAAGQPACGAGLACKACSGGGSQCTPSNQCCNCNGPCQTCNNGMCQPMARGEKGSCGLNQVCDGNGGCFTPECTGVGQCGDCRTCTNLACGPAGQGATCSQSRFCTADGRCVPCVAANQCGAGRTCDLTTNTCVNLCQPTAELCDGRDNDCDGAVDEGFALQTDPNNCGRCGNRCGTGLPCAGGQCGCPSGQEQVPGVGCRLSDGQACTPGQGVACRTTCNSWFEDTDRDGFGNPDGTVRRTCGNQPPNVAGVVLVQNSRDCCDLNSQVNPDQVGLFELPIQENCPRAKRYDYNCNGGVQYESNLGATTWRGACNDTTPPNDSNVACPLRTGIQVFPGNFAGITASDLFDANDDAALCGIPTVELIICQSVGVQCQGATDLAPRCN